MTKEHEDRVMEVTKQQVAFAELLNEIITGKVVRTSDVLTVDTTKFAFHIGQIEALVEVNDSGKNDIRISGYHIVVTDPYIEGKHIHYHLRHQLGVTPEIAQDILNTLQVSDK